MVQTVQVVAYILLVRRFLSMRPLEGSYVPSLAPRRTLTDST